MQLTPATKIFSIEEGRGISEHVEEKKTGRLAKQKQSKKSRKHIGRSNQLKSVHFSPNKADIQSS